ncbi:MAG: hypothetical protein BWK76_27460 [Desulfobulbaceae bacterium A2]|nr:MAG: hypothetical protein BWK76_27460 [Desulfobulbaceae bacterium A2]
MSKKKILAAVDGSAYSSQSLAYLSRLYGDDQDCDVELLHVVSASSSQTWMLEVDPYRSRPPEVERRLLAAQRYQNEAKDRLLRHGFSEQRVCCQALATSAGVATTIQHHAASGLYDALLIGRRGVGRIGEMLFGSVSAWLLEKCFDIPLWIVDGDVQTNRFLLAVHGSTRSLFAADHLGYMLQNRGETEILLYHSSALLQTRQDLDLTILHARWGEEWCREHLDSADNLFHAHEQILRDAGIAAERIRRLPAQHNLDASHDLLRQAKKHDCGTLVIGRRGPESTRRFLSSVSQRALQQFENLAAWIV